jgi:pentatricopeptide repeat protein
MGSHGTRGDIKGMMAVYEQMLQAGVAPDQQVYTVLLSNLGKFGYLDKMVEMFRYCVFQSVSVSEFIIIVS